MRYILVALTFMAFVLVGGALARDRAQVDRTRTSSNKPPEVRIQSLPKMRAACIRHVGPHEQIAAAWEKLIDAAQKKGLIDKSTIFLGLYYDYPGRTPAEKLRCDACFTVDKGISPLTDSHPLKRRRKTGA